MKVLTPYARGLIYYGHKYNKFYKKFRELENVSEDYRLLFEEEVERLKNKIFKYNEYLAISTKIDKKRLEIHIDGDISNVDEDTKDFQMLKGFDDYVYVIYRIIANKNDEKKFKNLVKNINKIIEDKLYEDSGEII